MDIEIRNGLAEARALAVEHSGALTAYVALGVVVPYLLLSSEPIFDLRTVRPRGFNIGRARAILRRPCGPEGISPRRAASTTTTTP